MSRSCLWLKGQISKDLNPIIVSRNCIEFDSKNGREKVWCPDTEDYEITLVTLEKALEESASYIAYPTSWCRATIETGIDSKGIKVMPFGAFLCMLNKL